jgi:hypothetical protein
MAEIVDLYAMVSRRVLAMPRSVAWADICDALDNRDLFCPESDAPYLRDIVKKGGAVSIR